MRKVAVLMLAIMVLALLTPAAFAADGAAQGTTNWVAITSGFAMAFASGLCGLGQAKATAAACEGLARNPGAAPGIRFALILGLVFIESVALYTFAIIFAKVS